MKKENAISIIVFVLLLTSIVTSVVPKIFNFIRPEGCILASFCLLLPLYGFYKTTDNKLQLYKLSTIDIIILIFYAYFLFIFFLSPRYNLDLGFLIVVTISTLLYFLIRIDFIELKILKTKSILHAILIFGLFQCIYAFLQLFSLVPNILGYKVGGTFGNPGILGNFIVISYAISTGLFMVENKSLVRKILLATSSIIMLAIIGVSLARTAWVSVTIVSFYIFREKIFYFFLKLREKVANTFIYLSLIIVFIVGLFLTVNIYKLKQDSADGRIFIWSRCVELVSEKPLFGGGYESFIPRYNTAQAKYFSENFENKRNSQLAGNIFCAYNDYLQISIEYGIIGLSIFLSLLFFSFKDPSNINKNQRQLLYIINSSLLGILVCMLFSFPLQNITIYLTLFILLAIKSSYHNSRFRKIKIHKNVFRTTIAISISIFTLAMSYISSAYDWQKAYTGCSKNSINNCLNEYKRLYPVLKHDRTFLYNYGTVLHTSGKLEKCIEHFEKYYDLNKDAETLMIMGDCYKQLKEYKNAEKSFIEASNITPHYFYPKYSLYKLYQITEEKTKQLEIAKVIQNMKVKVYSEQVRLIKSEINNYLLKHNTLNFK